MGHSDIPKLDTKGLRQFGLMLGFLFAVMCGLVLPWVWGWDNRPNLLWIGAGIAVAIWSMVAPDSLRVLYTGWMRVAMAIGNVVNSIILAIVYFMVVTPMGMVMRMKGKDPLRRLLDRRATSYRIPTKITSRNHFERPF